MFCTVCASFNPLDAAACRVCGASLRSFDLPVGTAFGGVRQRALQILMLIPAIVAVLVAASLWTRQNDVRTRASAAYADGEMAWNAGDYLAAARAFTAAGNWRDAPDRLAAAESALAPDRAALDLGIARIAQSDYAGAIDALLPAARRSPRLGSVTAQLAEARRLRVDELLHQSMAATNGHDLLAAERALNDAGAVDPSDERTLQRRSALLSDAGPVLFTRDQAIMLAAPDGGGAMVILDGYDAMLPAWSPDRKYIAFFAIEYADPQSQVSLYLFDPATGQTERLAGFASSHTAPVWSPDGRYIAFTSLQDYDPIRDSGPIGVRLADTVDGRLIDVTGRRFPLAFNPAFSPDGRTLYFISKDRISNEPPSLAPGDLYAVETGRIEHDPIYDNLTGGRVSDLWSVHPAPAGRMMLLYSLYSQQWYEPPRTAIRRFDPASGKMAQVVKGSGSLGAPVWSPDGDRFAFADGERSVVVIDGARQEHIEAPRQLSQEISWSPDGRRILASALIGDEPSLLVDLASSPPRAEDVPLRYDAESPYFGPPQWAPLSRSIESERIGTGLDSSE
jgi:Tol biopolymer transport system component